MPSLKGHGSVECSSKWRARLPSPTSAMNNQLLNSLQG